MPEYQKLVRDKIPDIIIANGETPLTRKIGNDSEYLDLLVIKLTEEKAELDAAQSVDEGIEEKADLLEVAKAIVSLLSNDESVEQMRVNKANERGTFESRIFLDKTE